MDGDPGESLPSEQEPPAETKPAEGEAKPNEPRPPQNEDAAGEPAQTKAEPEGLVVKFNGQEMTVPAEDVAAYVQKGLNYDRVAPKLQKAEENERIRQALEPFAAAAGMDVAQYVEFIERSGVDAEVQQLVAEGMPEARAKEYVEMKRENHRQAQTARAQKEAETQQNAFIPLVERYPDVKELPPEVMADIKAGTPPLAAYELYMTVS